MNVEGAANWHGLLFSSTHLSAEHNASAIWTELFIKPQAVTSNLVKTKLNLAEINTLLKTYKQTKQIRDQTMSP